MIAPQSGDAKIVTRSLVTIIIFLVGALVTFLALTIAYGNGFLVPMEPRESRLDVLSIFLAASILIITAVALMVALLAVFGYNVIREAAMDAGKKAGEEAGRKAATGIVQSSEFRTAILAESAESSDRTDDLAKALAEASGSGEDSGGAEH